MRFKKSKIPNKNFAADMLRMMPAGWSYAETSDEWIITSPPKGTGILYFTDVSFAPLNKGEVLTQLVSKIKAIENEAFHKKMVQAANIKKYQHNRFTQFGALAWIYDSKSMFFMKPIEELDSSDSEHFEEFKKMFKIVGVVTYRKNIEPFFPLLSLRRFAYLMPRLAEHEMIDLNKNQFYGMYPDPMDFSNYIDPFLVSAPALVALPLDRFTTSAILIPSGSIGLPYEATVGLPEMLLSSPTGASGRGHFDLFLGDSNLSSIFTRRYVIALCDSLNQFIDWTLAPSTCYNLDEKYDVEFGIQFVASIHAIFCSFIFSSRTLDPAERMLHVFMGFDRVANLTNNYGFLKGLLPNAVPTREPKIFESCFQKDTIDFCLSVISSSKIDRKIIQIFSSSAEESMQLLSDSVAHFDNFDYAIRMFRNFAHGAFLKDGGFYNTFSKGQARISPKISNLQYIFMLAFVLDPHRVLSNLANKARKY